MVNIEFTSGASTFTINNITLVRNFHSYVSGNKLRIVNAYDTRNQLLPYTLFSDISVNGVVPGSVVELAEILAPILFQKKEGSDTGGVVTLSGNIITKVVPVQIDWTQDSVQQVVNYVNSREFVVLGTQRILFKGIRIIGDVETSNAVESYFWEFKPGKGNYGVNGTPITSADIEYTSFVTNYQNNLINLGEIGTDPIEVFVNDSGPYGINSASLNVFKTLRQGNPVNYIYIGNSNNIGNGQTQTIAEDYIDVNATPVNPPASTGGLDVPMVLGLVPVSQADGSLVWEPKEQTSKITGELVLNPNWQGTGYEYHPWASWKKDGVQYTDTRPITAEPAHATLDRIDLWLLNLITGLIELLKGEPAENPVEPTYDPTTHLKGPILLVKAASVTPDGVSGETIYDGEGAGWTITAGNSFNTQSQNGDPFGTYCIETIEALPKDVAILFGRSTPLAFSEGMEIPYKIKNIVGKAHRFLISGTKPNNGKSISAWVEMPVAYSLTSLAWQYLSITVPPGFATVSNVWLMTSEAGMKYFLDDVRIVSGAGAVPSGGVTYEEFNALEQRVTTLEQNPGGGSSSIRRYLTIAAMLSDQANQPDESVCVSLDASADPTVDAGYAYYEYLGTTLGTLDDYRKLSEEESMDVGEVYTSAEKAKVATIGNRPVIVVSASRDLADTDHGAILLITATVTLTKPAVLRSDFGCEIDVDSTGLCTIGGTSTELDFPDGKVLDPGKMGTIYLRSDNLKLRGKGEFRI